MAESSIAAISATDTQYPQIINGYVCWSAAEVSAARRFENPRPAEETTRSQASVLAATSTRPQAVVPPPTYNSRATTPAETIRRGAQVDLYA